MESSLKEENLRAASVTSRDIKLANKEDEREKERQQRNSTSPRKTEPKSTSPTRPKLSKFESENLPKLEYDNITSPRLRVESKINKDKDVDSLGSVVSPRGKKYEFFPLLPIFPLSPRERSDSKLSKSDSDAITTNTHPRIGSSRIKTSDNNVVDLVSSNSKRKAQSMASPPKSKDLFFTTRDMKTKSKSSRFTRFFLPLQIKVKKIQKN